MREREKKREKEIERKNSRWQREKNGFKASHEF